MQPQTQLSRCFIVPLETPPESKEGKGKWRRQTWRDVMLQEILDALRPWPHPTMLFDIETLTGAHSGQQAKVIFWQDRGAKYADRCNLYARGQLTQTAMDVCWREGIAYNAKPGVCTEAEIKMIKDYAAKHNLAIMEMADFIKKVFYRQAKLNAQIAEPKLIIGHNPVFDFGALSHHTGKCCDEKLYGAVSLSLCNCRKADEGKFQACGYHPNIKIKKLGPGKHIMKVGSKYDGRNPRTHKPMYTDMCIEFLDTRQLAGALLGAGCDKSLGALCRMLKTEHQKGEELHGQEITEQYLDYARNDVWCTWDLWVKLRDLYKLWGIKKRITKIYSEASIGKGVYEELNVLPFFGYNQKTKQNTRDLTFDPKVIGIAMEGLFGGRSEARRRHHIFECMLPDFRSQYPTVNALMKLQDLLLCERLDIERGENTKAKVFLETVELADFQDPATWTKLRGFARVRPTHNDVLPFRTEYETSVGTKQINVGVNCIKSACDGWWSFADVLASKMITGRCPEILETVEFIPVGRQTTKVIKLFGKDDYTIDLSKGKDDLFTRVIELRATVKADRDKHPKTSPEYAELDAMQMALKLLANATSYGVLIEVVVDERAAEVPCMIYHGGKATKRTAKRKRTTEDGDLAEGFKVERPGKYSAPFGPLIPAGGRFLLGLAERLFRDRGVGYGICDTDALIPARPAGMSREAFREAVFEVAGPAGWFQPLSPYSDDEPLFALEDVNYRLRDEISGKVTRELEPLFCLAISAKRYAMFNIAPPSKKYPNGQTIVRKISGHGTGHLRRLDNYDPSLHPLTRPEHIAAPLDEKTGKRKYGDTAHGSTPRMLCDIWRIVIDCFREFPGGAKKALDKAEGILARLPQLQAIQYTQMTLSSIHLLKLFPNLPNKRGFQFFAVFPEPQCTVRSQDVLSVPLDQHQALCGTTLYASVPKGGVDDKLIEEWKTSKTGLFRRDNHEFPHGLFDPGWRLRLKTVAEALAGYFRHEEPKSVGETGELRRRIIVSLDKHFIGKETNPLDDDVELAQDDENPLVTSCDRVLRDDDRNLLPLLDAGLEGKYLSKLQQGKRFTPAELDIIKSRTNLLENGALVARGAVEDGYVHGYVSDPVWAARLKTWRELNTLHKSKLCFEDIAKLSDVPIEDIEAAARDGGYDDKCLDIDWDAIQAALNVLKGRTKRLARLKATSRKETARVERRRDKRKGVILLTELQAADFVVFPTEILTTSMDTAEMITADDECEMQDGLEIISSSSTSSAIEYWEPPARERRRRDAKADWIAQRRKAKADAQPDDPTPDKMDRSQEP